MNLQSYNWQLSTVAGHDQHGNEITVFELVHALDGTQKVAEIANLAPDMRDALAAQAAENYRIKRENEHLKQQLAALKPTNRESKLCQL